MTISAGKPNFWKNQHIKTNWQKIMEMSSGGDFPVIIPSPSFYISSSLVYFHLHPCGIFLFLSFYLIHFDLISFYLFSSFPWTSISQWIHSRASSSPSILQLEWFRKAWLLPTSATPLLKRDHLLDNTVVAEVSATWIDSH